MMMMSGIYPIIIYGLMAVSIFRAALTCIITTRSCADRVTLRSVHKTAASYSYLKSKTCEYETHKYLQFKSLIILASRNSESLFILQEASCNPANLLNRLSCSPICVYGKYAGNKKQERICT